MAPPTSPQQPVYHSPSLVNTRSRRGSARQSFTAHGSPLLDSPRTSLPKDTDAFSFDPKHIAAWCLEHELWIKLPAGLRAALISVQQSGAAVLTGLERLEKHSENLAGGRPNHKFEPDELVVQLDSLPPPRFARTTSDASSVFVSEVTSPFSARQSDSEVTSPIAEDSKITTPISPICLTPLETYVVDKRERPRDRDRSFSTPLEPQDSYYITEISTLFTEAAPRLRHAALRVDQEWCEVKRTHVFANDVVETFENAWITKKAEILRLSEEVRRKSAASSVPPTGLGWSA